MKHIPIGILCLVLMTFVSCGANENKHRDLHVDENNYTASVSEDKTDTYNKASENSSRKSRMKQLHVKSAWCDYQLENQAGNNYHPDNMTDGDPSTAWAARLSAIDDAYDNGIIVGPVFELESPSKISGIELLNGYCKNSSSFKNNTRATWVTIYRYHPEYDGEYGEDQMMGYIDRPDIIYEGPVKDSMTPQYFATSPSFDNSRTTRAVGLLFKKGHFAKGNKWNDLCMSGIRIYSH